MAGDFIGSNGPDYEQGNYENMYGKGGKDTLLSGATFARLYGGAQDDWLEYYGGGKAKLNGGGGDDTLIGGLGKVVFKTGGGHDTVVLNFAPDDQLDKVKDFNPRKDTLKLYGTVYAAPYDANGVLIKEAFRKGGKAKDADDRFGYNKKSGIVWYDADGNGEGAKVEVLKLSKGLDISHGDFHF